ncbi:hypothetical protein Q3P05_23440, partial [Ralstonia pseudosolanacearum]|uniref:hypothetical protein n=1 Tax=Ralstonia pseudosolanacearum TaxID=1310165 RepID=UPI002676AF0A
TPSVSPEFKIIGGPVSSNSIYATTPIRHVHFCALLRKHSLSNINPSPELNEVVDIPDSELIV